MTKQCKMHPRNGERGRGSEEEEGEGRKSRRGDGEGRSILES